MCKSSMNGSVIVHLPFLPAGCITRGRGQTICNERHGVLESALSLCGSRHTQTGTNAPIYRSPHELARGLHDAPAPLLHPFLLITLGGCGAGETAATATLQAEQAKQAQQQMEQLKQQIDQANAANTRRLQEAIDQAQ